VDYREIINDFLRQGLIKKQEINFVQIEKLTLRAQKDLIVAEANLKIDEEAVYNYAYLAMLRCGRSMIFLKGFRTTDGQQHKTVIEITRTILGKDFKTLVEKFDRMRKKRNQFTYDPSLPVSEREARNALKTARNFVQKVAQLIKKENPQRHFNF